MIANHENKNLEEIAKRISLFCINNNVFHYNKSFKEYIEYIIDNKYNGIFFQINELNNNNDLLLLVKNIKKEDYSFAKRKNNKLNAICEACKLSNKENYFGHFLINDIKLELFCIHTNFIENKIANIIVKIYKQ